MKGLLFWKMKCDTAVLLWQPEVFDGKTKEKPRFPCLGTCQEPEDAVLISLFKDSQERFSQSASAPSRQVCSISAEQQRRASSSSQRGPLTYPFWSRVSSPPPSLLLPSESSGFLFSRSGAYHLFLHRCPPPSSPSFTQGMKGYFFWGGGWDRSCLSCADPRGQWLSLVSPCLKKRAFCATPAPLCVPVGFLRGPGCVQR